MAKVKPANDLGIISVEDILGTTVTGTNKADILTFDIRSQHGTDPAHTTTLDGGNGDDALTLRLTQSQLAALTAETNLTLDANNAITGAALDLFSGNHPTTLTSIDLTVKSWQTVHIEVYPDPPPSWAGGDFSAVGQSIDLNLAAHTLEFEENTPPRADVANSSDAAAYFDGGTANAGLNFLPNYYVGTAFSDRMTADTNGSWLNGGDGNDFLYGNASNDILDGGQGNDFLSGSDGDDRLYGQAGNDILVGDVGNDTIVGDVGNDTIVGGTGNDTLDGGDGDDQLFGDAGDTLPDAGADTRGRSGG